MTTKAKKKKSGVDLIKEERKRQITEEGYTLEHDKMYNDPKDMVMAACVYASLGIGPNMDPNFVKDMEDSWPWDPKYFKPKDRIRNLVRAGALIAAALDRLNGD